MTTISNPKALQTTFAPMGLTHVPEVAKPAPTEGPYDWGTDCFVFRPDMTAAHLS
ncbi:hypothetical protein KUL25_13685 [Rhodobacteraceae bacterium N5(2021)]|uniref:Uncharacterized protein n=1 Tax=Gymnodinialimonas phycosphaerae TaxID=2841589 RepID=A0A975YEL6_9RHOB|nr:hypothetical protein [Gymnodinialimonas phycosphaerae]MBY4893817.1 hypothetical protein [Gymnodinialimonas phycosphaerae]